MTTSLLRGVQRVLRVPKCTIWDSFWKSFGLLLKPFWVILGSILCTLFVCMMLCEFRVSKTVFYVMLQGIPLFFGEIFLYRVIVQYAAVLILASVLVLISV